MGEEISVQIEANKASRKIDSYCCAMISIKLERSGHIPREISRNVFIGKDGEAQTVPRSTLLVYSKWTIPEKTQIRGC